jgi:spore germination protein KC
VFSAFFLLTGCWNYNELDKLAIVSGFAVDKKEDQYVVTYEIVDVKTGIDPQITTKLVTSAGSTLFDAARKSIKTVGKRLYFSHAEIIVISKELAQEGIVPILDWVSRDSELRYSLHFLISKNKPAKDILEQHAVTMDILSYELSNMLHAQKSLANAPYIEQWRFLEDMAETGISATLPAIDLTHIDDKTEPEISGTALFKEDKLVGFLDSEETKAMLFVKDKIKGGLLVIKEHKNGVETRITLEIFNNKTKLKPRCVDGRIIIDITTDTDVAIDENGGREDYTEGAGLEQLQSDAETMLEDSIKNVVKKTQAEFDCDVFGIGKALKVSMPKLWKQIEAKWDEKYKTVEIEVHSTINVKNTAYHAKPVKVGD